MEAGAPPPRSRGWRAERAEGDAERSEADGGGERSEQGGSLGVSPS